MYKLYKQEFFFLIVMILWVRSLVWLVWSLVKGEIKLLLQYELRMSKCKSWREERDCDREMWALLGRLPVNTYRKQPIILFLFLFLEFENAQWRKAKQMQPMWNIVNTYPKHYSLPFSNQPISGNWKYSVEKIRSHSMANSSSCLLYTSDAADE